MDVHDNRRASEDVKPPSSAMLLVDLPSADSLFKFDDIVAVPDELENPARFPHLNAEQYLVACEEANYIPPFLLGMWRCC